MIKQQLSELLECKDYRTMKKLLEEMEEADIAEFLDEMPSDKAMPIFRLLSKGKSVEVFSYFQPETQEQIIKSL